MNFIKGWLREDIANMHAYQVANSSGFIKLDAMENPYNIPAALQKQHYNYLQKAALNRYPDAEAKSLKQALRVHIGITHSDDILLGNGSDELVLLLALACDKNAVIMSPKPSFVMYDIIARVNHLRHIFLPLNEDFSLDISRCLRLISKHQPKLIFLAYPNNPSGNLFAKDDIKAIIEATSALVVVDEAYYGYSDKSFLGELANYENLAVLRTFSKIGLAALRLGLLISRSELINALNKIRLPYNINTFTQRSAYFFLKNFAFFTKQIRRVIAQRELLFQELSALTPIKPYPSSANFILFKARYAEALFAYLLSEKILIKNLAKQEALKDCLRVSIGKGKENQKFLNAVKIFYEQH